MQVENKQPVPDIKLVNMTAGEVFHTPEYPGEFFIRIPSAEVSGIAKPVTAVQLRTGHLFRLDFDLVVIPVPTAILRFDGATE